MPSAKDAAQEALDHLPDQASWDDIMYELYVKQKVDKGLQAAESGMTLSHSEAKRRLLADEG